MASEFEAPVFALHLMAYTSKGQCDSNNPNNLKPPLTCDNYVLEGNLDTGYLAYLVVVSPSPEVPNFAGIACGIEYDGTHFQGVDVFGWYLCADMEDKTDGGGGLWPESQGGNQITWDPGENCQDQVLPSNGVHAVAGAFYVFAYTADEFRVTPNKNLPGGPALSVTDCQGTSWRIDLKAFGSCTAVASFGGAMSINPCVVPDYCQWTPVEAVTWGEIKDRYGRD
jgi:hypothetical protein